METKMLEFSLVMKKFALSEEQLNLAIKRMKKRHPLEEWIVIRLAPNGKEKIIYLRYEFVLWLEQVYLSRGGSYLDKEILFFKNQITVLESELNIIPVEETYSSATPQELEKRFNKNVGAIRMAIQRMVQGKNLYLTKSSNGKVLIEPAGVRWITEKYYRKEYLEKLEYYKIDLQQIKQQRRKST